MPEFIKSENTSWEVLSDRVAIKATDLSSLKYNEIRITNEVKDFFSLEHMARHERREVFLHFQGTPYPCAVYLDSFEKGRGKMRWGKKFRSVFSGMVSGYFFDGSDSPSVPLLRFYKWDALNYEISLIFVREIIDHTVEVDDRTLAPWEHYRLIEENFMWRIEAMKHHGTACAICGFDYSKTYGDAGKGRMKIHLKRAMSDKDFLPDPEKDLLPVCANCHELLHEGLEEQELRSIVQMHREMQKGRMPRGSRND
ncbi:hypothetical protein ABB02_00739 [Clostridiaceae bacterium JG1575]|nr:hypothetical protein ABB02_00739 [Clostridiaceae bacterium JG1575]